MLTCCLYRNESYESRIQLAILDHNQHIKRNKRLNKKGEIIYQRKYKKLDTTPLLEKKKYEYIPELLLAISKQREQSSTNLKRKTTRPSSHPSKIPQLTHVNWLPVSNHVLQKYNYLPYNHNKSNEQLVL